ncbi:Hypothetical predicted protein [Olea europaea subsp. europaea]|uniref:Uncharacterized protein n=1 Tax=Olea europaea subsp. europaea TaxID=158383 RepID=A0A8S0RFM2_OLEEU|nr:Hypothetical predicted protein [Olea europaea subsp. europaea]
MDEKSIVVGSVMSKSGCWSLLKGGFTVDQYMKAQLYFLSNNTYVRLWLDNVSLKSFAKGQWSKQQEKSTLEVRNCMYALLFIDRSLLYVQCCYFISPST